MNDQITVDAAPAGLPEVPSDINPQNVSSYVDNLSKEQLDALLNPPAPGVPEPVADEEDGKEPEQNPVPEVDSVEPVFTPEEYASADPKTKAIYDSYIAALEQAEAPAELPPELEDPFIKARMEYIKNGNADPIAQTVPFTAIANDDAVDSILEVLSDENATPEAIREGSKAKVIELLQIAADEAALRTKGNLDIQYKQEAEAKAERAWAEAAFPAFAQSVPEFKNAGPLLVPGADGGMIVNPENKPAREFVTWIGKGLENGEFSNSFVKSRGFDKMYQIYKMEKADSAGGYVAGIKAKTRSEILAQLRNSKNAALASSTAPTLPMGQSGQPATQMIHGVDIARIKAGDESYAKSAFARIPTLKQMNEVMEALQK